MNSAALDHLAIIMDGNGRWAHQRGLARSEGHKAGTQSAKTIVTACRQRNIPYLTLYTFSRENWSRPKEEISFLFDLLVRFLRRELSALQEQGIRLNILGELQGVPATPRRAIEYVCRQTAGGQAMTLNLALNYSGRDDILQACRHMLREGIAPEMVTEEVFARYLSTAHQPDPDLLIRTSGEKRLSNYLLYQCAYTEFLFSPVLWPDFDETELDAALQEYATRQRRFGNIR
ncbi:MAG: polyprenyl diphosphate synthase [Thermodesulfobacteriota bacterium]